MTFRPSGDYKSTFIDIKYIEAISQLNFLQEGQRKPPTSVVRMNLARRGTP